MKKNWMQYLTLLLCFILLFLCIAQTYRLEAYRSEVGREMDNLKNQLTSAIDGISYDLRNELESSSNPVESYDVTLAQIDNETRSFSLDVHITLKQWDEDTTVSLVTVSEKDKDIQYMAHDGTGTFTAAVNVPLADSDGVLLEAMVTTGGVSTRIDLEEYPDIDSLIPLRSDGCGWTETTYRKGVLILDFEQFLAWQYEPGSISNARFEIYVNDELRQSIAAHVNSNHSFQLLSTELACENNSTVRLFFRCDDSFGLSYRFHCLEMFIEEGNVVESISNDEMDIFWTSEATNCDH